MIASDRPSAVRQQQATARWRPTAEDRRRRLSPPLSTFSSSSSSSPSSWSTRRRRHYVVPHAKGLRLGIGNSPNSPRKRMGDHLLEEGLASGDPTLIEAASAPPTPAELLPRPLPPAPREASVGAVLKFLGQLALEDGSLRWRLVVAAMLVVASKAAGILAPLQLKDAVDALAAEAVVASSSSSSSSFAASASASSSFASALASRPATLRALLMFTCSRLFSALARELKVSFFFPFSGVGQRAALIFFLLTSSLSLALFPSFYLSSSLSLSLSLSQTHTNKNTQTHKRARCSRPWRRRRRAASRTAPTLASWPWSSTTT